jgi:hypothetical protein
MASKEDLQRLDTIILAVLCQQVADNPTIDNQVAEKAWQLKRKWVMLQIERTPQPADYKLNDQLIEQEKKLGIQMANFLAIVL